jgi:hypothetical protein
MRERGVIFNSKNHWQMSLSLTIITLQHLGFEMPTEWKTMDLGFQKILH